MISPSLYVDSSSRVGVSHLLLGFWRWKISRLYVSVSKELSVSDFLFPPSSQQNIILQKKKGDETLKYGMFIISHALLSVPLKQHNNGTTIPKGYVNKN